MKKIGLLSLMLALGFSAQSQLSMQIRVYAGGHSSTFQTKGDALQTDFTLGYHGGFAFRINTGNIYFEPGFFFYRTEAIIPDTLREEWKVLLGINDPQLWYNSFTLPAVVGYSIIDVPIFKWHVFGGFAMNVSIKSELRDGRESILKLKAKRDLGFTNPRFDLRLGSGIDLAFFTVDFAYNLGLNNVSTDLARTQSHKLELNIGVIF